LRLFPSMALVGAHSDFAFCKPRIGFAVSV